MIDREKVIKGLNCCCHTDGSNCAKCPYDIADSDCTALMSMDALALLKEQEAVVRCKDCEHAEKWYGDKSRCFLWHETGIGVFDDGFCNYGKKKAD